MVTYSIPNSYVLFLRIAMYRLKQRIRTKEACSAWCPGLEEVDDPPAGTATPEPAEGFDPARPCGVDEVDAKPFDEAGTWRLPPAVEDDRSGGVGEEGPSGDPFRWSEMKDSAARPVGDTTESERSTARDSVSQY